MTSPFPYVSILYSFFKKKLGIVLEFTSIQVYLNDLSLLPNKPITHDIPVT